MIKYIRVRPPVSVYIRVDKPSRNLGGNASQVLDFPGLYSSYATESEELTAENWRTKVIEVVYCTVPFGVQPHADMVLDLDSRWPADEDYFSLN